jgi:signal transduction histidine kinase
MWTAIAEQWKRFLLPPKPDATADHMTAAEIAGTAAAHRRPGYLRRHPGLAAVGLIVCLLLTNWVRVRDGHGGDHGAIPLISLLVVVPLVWRYRAPMLTFLFAAAAAAVQWALTGPLFVDLALLISFYTVAATSSRKRTLVAAGILEFGVIIAVARYGHGGYALAALFLSGLVVAAGMLGINIQVRRAYMAEVESRAARLEYERDQQGRLAVAAERNRIAREMHDIVAHNLSVMIALNDGASFTLRSDPERAAGAVREASSVGRTALAELRRALAVLREGDPAPGLLSDEAASRAPAPKIADLDRLLAPIRRTGLEISLTLEGPVAALSSGLQLTVYRLVQESLTNTVKHAIDADHAAVTIRTGPAGTEVWVIDNGQPPQRAPHPPVPGSGQGIIGMHERAAGHGGRVAAGPTATGWMVRAWFPVETVAETPTETIPVSPPATAERVGVAR